MKKHATIIVLMGLMLITTACQRRIGGNQYNSASVGEASRGYQGVIISTRKVQVSEADRLQDNSTGIGAGALAGGLLGSAFGKGSGTLVGIGAGALAGGVAGAFVQDSLGQQDATEYTVRCSDGSILTVVQADETPLAVGQRVIVSISTGQNSGRSRIIADNSGMPQEVQQVNLPTQSSPSIVINNR